MPLSDVFTRCTEHIISIGGEVPNSLEEVLSVCAVAFRKGTCNVKAFDKTFGAESEGAKEGFDLSREDFVSSLRASVEKEVSKSSYTRPADLQRLGREVFNLRETHFRQERTHAWVENMERHAPVVAKMMRITALGPDDPRTPALLDDFDKTVVNPQK